VDHLRDQSSGEIYWFNTDLNGAPLEVTDERGAVRWSGQYGSFGEVRHQSEGFSRLVNRTAMAHQPLRYAGQYADGETGCTITCSATTTRRSGGLLCRIRLG
jgi:uncharacterized protein RhaS with RHS repeats